MEDLRIVKDWEGKSRFVELIHFNICKSLGREMKTLLVSWILCVGDNAGGFEL